MTALRVTALALLGGLALAGALTSGAAGPELLRDRDLILRLLRHGEVNLDPPVARELPSSESQLRIRRVGLSLDGHSIRAAFRDKTRRVPASRALGVAYVDAWYNELAAYVVARELGLDMIPPTVFRRLHIAKTGLRKSRRARSGALQLWVENTAVEYDLQAGTVAYPGEPRVKNWQLSDILAFDCVIGNVDRHAGNILIDLNPRFPPPAPTGGSEPLLGKLWAIDHSRAFHRDGRIDTAGCKLERLARRPVSLALFRGLQRWDPAQVADALRKTGLTDRQLDSLHLEVLADRATRVRSHLEALRDRSGLADEAFFSDGVWHRVR